MALYIFMSWYTPYAKEVDATNVAWKSPAVKKNGLKAATLKSASFVYRA